MSYVSLNEDIEYMIKIILIGDSGVGKSNLLSRYCKNEFNLNSKATIGTDFHSKDIDIGDIGVKVQFWDTAGQEKFRAMTSQYYKECHGIILVYDVTKQETFDNCLNWYQDVKENNKSDYDMILLGNKIDLVDQRKITQEQGLKFAEKQNMKFMEVSALSNEDQCVNKAFFSFIQQITQKLQAQKIETENNEQYTSGIKNKRKLQTVTTKKSCC